MINHHIEQVVFQVWSFYSTCMLHHHHCLFVSVYVCYISIIIDCISCYTSYQYPIACFMAHTASALKVNSLSWPRLLIYRVNVSQRRFCNMFFHNFIYYCTIYSVRKCLLENTLKITISATNNNSRHTMLIYLSFQLRCVANKKESNMDWRLMFV